MPAASGRKPRKWNRVVKPKPRRRGTSIAASLLALSFQVISDDDEIGPRNGEAHGLRRLNEFPDALDLGDLPDQRDERTVDGQCERASRLQPLILGPQRRDEHRIVERASGARSPRTSGASASPSRRAASDTKIASENAGRRNQR